MHSESRWQFLIDAVETAIGEDRDYIASFKLRCERRYDFVRTGVKFGDQTMLDGVIRDGLWCAFCDVHMGGHAEYTAKKAGITRQAQDEFALASHRKAVAAMDEASMMQTRGW